MTTRSRNQRRALALLVAALVLLAGLAAQAAQPDRRSRLTVFQAEAGGDATWFDLGTADGGPGADPGDLLLEHKPVADPRTGQRVGEAVTRVQVAATAGEDALFILDCTVRLGGDAIVFYGSGRFSDLATGVTFAVTGGTGRYAGAAGTVRVVPGELAGETGVTMTFDLARADRAG